MRWRILIFLSYFAEAFEFIVLFTLGPFAFAAGALYAKIQMNREKKEKERHPNLRKLY